MSNHPRFEVVRTDAGFHGRYRAANGRVVWVTESMTRKVGVENAISTITGTFVYPQDGRRVVRMTNDRAVEVRYLDLRGGAS